MLRYCIYTPFVWVGMLTLRVNQTAVKARPTESCRNTFFLTDCHLDDLHGVLDCVCFSCSGQLMSCTSDRP